MRCDQENCHSSIRIEIHSGQCPGMEHRPCGCGLTRHRIKSGRIMDMRYAACIIVESTGQNTDGHIRALKVQPATVQKRPRPPLGFLHARGYYGCQFDLCPCQCHCDRREQKLRADDSAGLRGTAPAAPSAASRRYHSGNISSQSPSTLSLCFHLHSVFRRPH